jgi:hypothetical protein
VLLASLVAVVCIEAVPRARDGGLKVVDLIPASMSGETNQDSEPFLAVDPRRPDLMTASAFTSNPAGPRDAAPIFVSRDGGDTWVLNSIVPSQSETADISHAFGGPGSSLYASILALPMARTTTLRDVVSPDVTTPVVMKLLSTRADVDQPWIQTITVGNQSRLYIGMNDFSVGDGRTATVDVSLDGSTYTSYHIERRDTAGQDGPSVRPCAAKDGTVYAAFLSWTKFANGIATANVVVVRDDKGATSAPAFESLVDTSDNKPGRIVAAGVSIPWKNAPALGQQRIGSTLSMAVDPNNSKRAFIAWGDRGTGSDVYAIHIRGTRDGGVTWSSTDLLTLHNAVNVALAVSDSSVASPTVGVLYQQLVENRWITTLLQSGDDFRTNTLQILAKPPANAPTPQFQPYLGDYINLVATGIEFRGIFSASNVPDRGNFPAVEPTYQRQTDFVLHALKNGNATVAPSIDPFFVKVPIAGSL